MSAQVPDHSHCPGFSENISAISTPLSKYLQTNGMDILTAHRLVVGTQDSLKEYDRDFVGVKQAADSFLEGQCRASKTG